MKKTLLILVSVFSCLLSCTALQEEEGSMSYIQAGLETLSTKVQISEEKTVWQYRDRIGIYFNDGLAEQWTYLGEDGAQSGMIGGITHHSLTEKKTALYPFSSTATFRQGVISTSINGNPVLVASSSNDMLRFSYVCSCIAVCIKGSGTLEGIGLKSLGGEAIAGDIEIDTSEWPMMASIASDEAESIFFDTDLSLSCEKGSFVYFYLPSVCLKSGFSIDCHFSDDVHRSFSFPERVELALGKVLVFNIDASRFEEDIWDFDFRSSNILRLPTSYKSGIFNDETGYPNGKTFSTSDGKTLTFYTIDGQDDKGTTGVKYNLSGEGEPYNWVQFGRAGSYIRMPGRAGYTIAEVSLTPRLNTGSPYFSLTADGYSSISPKYYHMTPGEAFSVPMDGLKEGQPCFMMINTTMVSLYRIKIKYVKKI